MLQVGYVRNQGMELRNRYDANQASQFDRAKPTGIQACRPYQRVGFIGVNTSRTHSNSNGLGVRLERRCSAGLSLLATHRRMKPLGMRAHDQYTVMLIDNIRHNHGPQGAPHRSIISWAYDLAFGPGYPFGRSSGGALGRVIGAGKSTASRQPGSGNHFGTRSNGSNRVGSRALEEGRCGRAASSAAGAPRCGGAAPMPSQTCRSRAMDREGVIFGRGALNFGMATFKDTETREAVRLQIRCEMLNPFNSVNPAKPNIDVSTRQFGTISGATDAKIIQIGVKVIF